MITKSFFEFANAKTYVFGDSVLCLESISDQLVEAWKNKIKWYFENRHLKDLNRIDGEPMEFEWKIFTRFTTLGILEEIQKYMTELQCESEQFKDRIIYMSMYNDIVWRERGNTEMCEKIQLQLRTMLADSRSEVGHFWLPGSEKKWCGTYSDKPDGDWDRTDGQMMLNLAESSHPIFRATSALERGE